MKRRLVVSLAGLSMLGLGMAGVATPAKGAEEGGAPQEKCAVMVDDGTHPEHLELVPALHVLDLGASDAFALPAGTPGTVKAVECGRVSIAPQNRDYKVLQAGFVLFIVADGRVGVLEIVDGRLRYRMLKGQMSAEEGKAVEDYLNAAQVHFQRPAPAAR